MFTERSRRGMPIPFARWLVVAACAILSSAVRTPGQACDPQWAEGVFGLPGVNREIFDMITWDHGVGQSLYICGNFEIVGSVEASNIARWDGRAWSPLGSGISRSYAMCVFDDGTGEKLYAGASRWTGDEWEPVGAGFFGTVEALAVFDDGDGPVLFAGGALNRSGSGAPGSLLGVAQWDGSRWNPVGSGLGRPSNDVFDMEVFDDGTGPALYAVGEFVATGDGRTVNYIARWDGVSWQPLEGPDGIGLDALANALAVYDDGSGPALYVGGRFESAGGVPARHVARWDGTGWSALGEGIDAVPFDMEVYDDGSGPALFVSGVIPHASGPYQSVARWDGRRWSDPGAQTDGIVRALAVFDDGSGKKLCAGGRFPAAAGQYTAALTTWDGSVWSPIESPGLHAGLDDDALAAVTFDDGTGPKLFVGGQFEHAGGERVNYAARWDGARWAALDGGLDGSVLSLAVFDDGAGPALYAGGWFRNAGGRPARGVARWDGRAWSPVGAGDPPGLDGAVRALAVFDDGRGPALYAGGDFQTADGRSVKHVARWDGTSWTPVGGGVPEPVRSLHVFDAGKGPVLYAGGDVQQLPGWRFNGLRRWDGLEWRALPWLVSGTVDAMATYDDGRGPALYVVGNLEVSGVPGTRNIARWDGTRFEPLRNGLANFGFSAATFDAGDGPRLVVGGQFSRAYGGAGDYLAQWDGRDWAPLEPADASVSGIVSVLHAHDDGSGPALFAGGRFTSAGGHASSRIARYGCVLPPCEADLDGDGELTAMDFLVFQTLFDAGDARADFDGDGALTLFDFLAYQNAFAAGCP